MTEMTGVELLTYNRYYRLIKQEDPHLSEPAIVTKAKAHTADWMSRRNEGYTERAKTEYDIWANV